MRVVKNSELNRIDAPAPKPEPVAEHLKIHPGKVDMTSEEAAALNGYADEGYRDMNRWNRTRYYDGEGYYGTVRELRLASDAIDRIFDKSSMPTAGRVYRGIKDTSQIDSDYGLEVGARIIDRAHVSTTSNPEVAARYSGDSGVVAVIELPKGHKAISIKNNIEITDDDPFREDSQAMSDWEAEILLPRNTEFEIVSEHEDMIDGKLLRVLTMRPVVDVDDIPEPDPVPEPTPEPTPEPIKPSAIAVGSVVTVDERRAVVERIGPTTARVKYLDDGTVKAVRTEKLKLAGGENDPAPEPVGQPDTRPDPIKQPEPAGDAAGPQPDVRDGAADAYDGLRPDQRESLLRDLAGVGITPQAAEKIVSKMDELRRKYGVRYGRIGAVDVNDPWTKRATAYVQQNGWMAFHPKFANDERDLIRMESQGWLAVGSLRGLVAHETTHMLQFGFSEKGSAQFQYAWNKAEQFVTDTQFGGSRTKFVNRRNQISRYGARDDNGVEIQAEVFSAMNSTDTHDIPDWLHEFKRVFDETYANDDLEFNAYDIEGPNKPTNTERGGGSEDPKDYSKPTIHPPLPKPLPPPLDVKFEGAFPVVGVNSTTGVELVQVIRPDGRAVKTEIETAPLIDYLVRDGINVKWGAQGNLFDRQSPTGWTPAILTFEDKESFDRFNDESGLDVEYHDPFNPTKVQLQDSRPTINAIRAVGNKDLYQVKLNPSQLRYIARRMYKKKHGIIDTNVRYPQPIGEARSTIDLDEPNGIPMEWDVDPDWASELDEMLAADAMAPADRPAGFPSELLQASTGDIFAGRVAGWRPVFVSSDPESPDSNPAGGVNASNFVERDGRRYFVKDTTENGVSGALTEQDASALLRGAGNPAPYAEAGTEESALVVTEIAGRDRDDLGPLKSYEDAFGMYSDDAKLNLRDPNQLVKITVADLVMGNVDRHPGNVIFAEDADGKRHLFPIDHELSMSGPIPEEDGRDLSYHLDDVLLTALGVPTTSYLAGLGEEEARRRVMAEVDLLEKTANSMSWRSEWNRNNVLGRIKAMKANPDAVMVKLGFEPEPTDPYAGIDDEVVDILPPTDDDFDAVNPNRYRATDFSPGETVQRVSNGETGEVEEIDEMSDSLMVKFGDAPAEEVYPEELEKVDTPSSAPATRRRTDADPVYTPAPAAPQPVTPPAKYAPGARVKDANGRTGTVVEDYDSAGGLMKVRWDDTGTTFYEDVDRLLPSDAPVVIPRYAGPERAVPSDRPADFPGEMINVSSSFLVDGQHPDFPLAGRKVPNGTSSFNFLSNPKTGKTYFAKHAQDTGQEGANAEADASRLLRNMGLQAPYTESGGDDGWLVVSEFAGPDLADVSQVTELMGNDPTLGDMDLADPRSLLTLGVSDLVLMNGDRHGGNLFLGRDANDEGVLLPIDHEYTFFIGAFTGKMPEEDGSDLAKYLGQVRLDAYGVALRELARNMRAEDLRAEIRKDLEQMRRVVETMEWADVRNKEGLMAMNTAMLNNIDAVMDRLLNFKGVTEGRDKNTN